MGGAPGLVQLCGMCGHEWGNGTCLWWQWGWGGREPQQLGFGARVLWLRVSSLFRLIIWPCVALQLLNMGFLQLFPSAVVELLHAALSSEGPCNFCSALLLKRVLEPVVFGGRCVLPSFLGRGGNGILPLTGVLFSNSGKEQWEWRISPGFLPQSFLLLLGYCFQYVAYNTTYCSEWDSIEINC